MLQNAFMNTLEQLLTSPSSRNTAIKVLSVPIFIQNELMHKNVNSIHIPVCVESNVI